MKITKQLQLTVATLATFSVGAAVYSNANTSRSQLDSSVVNKSGLVRGGAQRLVKLEINGTPNDKLVATLDTLIDGLINGSEELKLPKAKNADYLANIQAVEASWKDLKVTIADYRKNPKLLSKLIADSETYFELTNKMVSSAEAFATDNINSITTSTWAIMALNLGVLGFVLMNITRVNKLLKSSVKVVSGSSAKIVDTLETQGRIISDQTSSVKATTVTVEALGTTSLQAAQKAGSSANSAREALDLSENGVKTVEKTVKGIEDLQGKVAAIADKIMQLSEQTSQIETVSNLVADVADQTNMLALNAAVEAARAGEQGKGFAVVAGEIRKLADQSRTSADKINILVGDIQSSINSTVMVTDEGNKTAIAGIEVARDTSDVFANIAKSINKVFETTQDIATSSKMQAVSVQQAVSAMNAINLGAKESEAVVNQVKESTDELSSISTRLIATI